MQSRHILKFSAILLCVSISYNSYARQYTQTAFSPSPETTELITRNISQAEHTIRVAAYSFTSQPVADALIEAHKKGIDVKVVVDKTQQNAHTHSIIGQLAQVGIPVRVDRKHSIMHDKYIVIDDHTLETGSFNYTANAEKHNAENVVVIRNNPGLAEKYLTDWKRLWDESDEYVARGDDSNDSENDQEGK